MTGPRQLLLIWLAWSLIMMGFMSFAPMRLQPQRPDHVLPWTAAETGAESVHGKPYLREPTLNGLVAWDSEFYLGIAIAGYDDIEGIAPVQSGGELRSKSYAYLPLYPYLMKALHWPLALLGISGIAAATVAGALISLLGTLCGLLAIHELARPELGETGAVRSACMMLIFPASFYFAVIYSEGLFVALAFGALALLKRERWAAAALLAALATWTRSVGVVLLLPMLMAWTGAFFRSGGRWALPGLASTEGCRLLATLPILFAPLASYFGWRAVYGPNFDFVQAHWFGNRLLGLRETMQAWQDLLLHAGEWPQARFNLALSLAAVAFALVSCVWEARRYPQIALFGSIALLIPMTSGATSINSALRYVLVVPTLWILLGRMTANPVMDRAWSLLSILLLAIQAYLFSTDMWSS